MLIMGEVMWEGIILILWYSNKNENGKVWNSLGVGYLRIKWL